MCQPKFLPEPDATPISYGNRARVPTGNRSRTISLQELMEHFHLPINEAACKLGVCVTVLKQQCREHGIQRWPFRKVRKLDNMLHALETSTPPEKLRPFALTNGEDERKRKIQNVKGALCQLLVDPNSAAHLKIGKVKNSRPREDNFKATNPTTPTSPSSSSLMESSAGISSAHAEAAQEETKDLLMHKLWSTIHKAPLSFLDLPPKASSDDCEPSESPVELDLLSRLGCDEAGESKASTGKCSSPRDTSEPCDVSGVTDLPTAASPSMSSANGHHIRTESLLEVFQTYEAGLNPAVKRQRVFNVRAGSAIVLPIQGNVYPEAPHNIPINPWALLQGFQATGLAPFPFLVAAHPPATLQQLATSMMVTQSRRPSAALIQ